MLKVNSELHKLKAVRNDILSCEGTLAANSTINHHQQEQSQQAKELSANNLPALKPSGCMKLLQRSSGQESSNGLAVAPSESATGSTSGYGADEGGSASPLDSMADSFRPVLMLLQKPPDDSQSGNYASPLVNQTVKILRRPTQSNESRNSDLKPKQPIKSLKQREQEYAEARLRILGSAKNPEDEM